MAAPTMTNAHPLTLVPALPAPALRATRVVVADDGAVVLEARTAGREARCPVCHQLTARVQSRYRRTLADLSAQGALRDARLRAPDLHRAPRAIRGPVRPAHDPSTTEDAAAFTLLDRAPSLPCLRPWLDAASPRLRELHLGSLAAIERVALEGGGVAVLPAPLVARHLESDALRPVFAAMQPSVAQHFAARLDDPRRPLLEALGALCATPRGRAEQVRRA